MNASQNTSVSLRGDLLAQKIYADGTKETIFEEKNLIMLVSKQRLLSMTYQSSGSWDPINRLAVGTGGSIDPAGLFPKIVTQDMTDLYDPLMMLTTYNELDNDIPKITFITDLDQGMGNGELITEAGLFTVAGSMFNMKTFPGITKTSEFSLHFEWTIRIS
jgi:hypothetical protein